MTLDSIRRTSMDIGSSLNKEATELREKIGSIQARADKLQPSDPEFSTKLSALSDELAAVGEIPDSAKLPQYIKQPVKKKRATD